MSEEKIMSSSELKLWMGSVSIKDSHRLHILLAESIISLSKYQNEGDPINRKDILSNALVIFESLTGYKIDINKIENFL